MKGATRRYVLLMTSNRKDPDVPRRSAWLMAVLASLTISLSACSSSSTPQGGRSSATSGAGAPGSSSDTSPTTTNCIPQGASAGDADADNSGGPSDGDGCM